MHSDSVNLTRQPLDWQLAHRIVDGNAGGIALFAGTTRAEKRASDGAELSALDYEAYEEMAVAQLRELVATARAKWPIVRVAIQHRIGRVAVGEASVIIAVACPHRADAFEGCRFLIDELKAVVTIWKKEMWSNGTASWGTNARRDTDAT